MQRLKSDNKPNANKSNNIDGAHNPSNGIVLMGTYESVLSGGDEKASANHYPFTEDKWNSRLAWSYGDLPFETREQQAIF